jgi:hypothetical protein
MEYAALPSPQRIHQTIEAGQARGIHAELAQMKEDALARIQTIIPEQAVVMTGGYVTLQ